MAHPISRVQSLSSLVIVSLYPVEDLSDLLFPKIALSLSWLQQEPFSLSPGRKLALHFFFYFARGAFGWESTLLKDLPRNRFLFSEKNPFLLIWLLFFWECTHDWGYYKDGHLGYTIPVCRNVPSVYEANMLQTCLKGVRWLFSRYVCSEHSVLCMISGNAAGGSGKKIESFTRSCELLRWKPIRLRRFIKIKKQTG